MGKKKTNVEYNDYIDGEKLRDNTEIRTSLQDSTSSAQSTSAPTVCHDSGTSRIPGKIRDASKKPPLTHFLCLPLVTEVSRKSLQEGLQTLKQELSRDGLVPIKSVRPVGTLHLTLGVMSLDSESLREACLYLRDLDLHRLLRDISHQKLAEKAAEEGAISENLIAASMPDTDALSVNLEKLIPMQSAKNTSVLYAEPKDVSSRLVPFASTVKERFEKEGWVVKENRPLKLHATIINTIYGKSEARKNNKSKATGQNRFSQHVPQSNINGDETTANEQERAQGCGPNAKSWMRFDASKLIDEYKDFTWAQDIQVDRVQICKMGAKKIWSSGKEGAGEVLDERYEVVCEKGIFE